MELNPISPFASVDFRAKPSPMDLKRGDLEPMALPGSTQEPMPIKQTKLPEEKASELKDKFQDFVGQTFFSELIKSLRTAQQGASYFNGGRAEQVFQGQFDQMMSEHLSEASAQSISDPMFELFQLGRMSG